MSCLTPEQIDLLARGESEASETDAIRRHLDTCESCRCRLDEYLANDELLRKVRQTPEQIELLGRGNLDERRANEEILLELEEAAGTTVTVRSPAPSDSMDLPSEPQSTRLTPPQIPNFELVRFLGKGGFGKVWLAKSLVGVHRAVKVLPKDARTRIEFEGVRLYERHARRHPHLVEILHEGETDSDFYYVMELADGYTTAPTFDYDAYEPRTLAGDLARRGRLPVQEALNLTLDLLDGLQHLHEAGLLHRDIKPGNVLFVEGRPKLADLGLVTRLCGPKDRSRTRAYAPPDGVVDKTGDLYCLGKTLYEMVTGANGDQFPHPPDGLDNKTEARLAEVAPIIDKACQEQPEARFQSADDMAAAIRKCREKLFPEQPVPDHPSRRWRAVLFAVAVLAIGGLLAIVVLRQSGLVPAVAPPSPTQVAAAAPGLQLWWKENGQAPITPLKPSSVPLRTGQLVKVQVKLKRLAYACVLWIDAAGNSEVHPLEAAAGNKPGTDFELPAGEFWAPLKDPAGTETVVLLASDKPITDRQALLERIRKLGPAPTVDGRAVLQLVGGQITETPAIQSRGPDMRNPVRGGPLTTPGLLDKLKGEFGGEFEVIEAIAFPHITTQPAAAR